MASNKQPTIAVVTAQYCEKVAVDAMIENKETFVRYTTVGKFALALGFRKCFITRAKSRQQQTYLNERNEKTNLIYGNFLGSILIKLGISSLAGSMLLKPYTII